MLVGVSRLGVLRLGPDGARDATYGSDGVAAFALPPGSGANAAPTIGRLALDGHGGVLVRADYFPDDDPHPDAKLVRLDGAGRQDEAFADRGALSPPGVVDPFVDPEGHILVPSGVGCPLPGDDSCGLAVDRFDAGGRSLAPPNFTVSASTRGPATAVGTDGQGRIVLAGDNGDFPGVVVARLSDDGRTDVHFGACGVATPPVPNLPEPSEVVVERSGRIVVAGIDRAASGASRAVSFALRGGPGATPTDGPPKVAPGLHPDITREGEPVGTVRRLRLPYRAAVEGRLTATMRVTGSGNDAKTRSGLHRLDIPRVLAHAAANVRPCHTAGPVLRVSPRVRGRLRALHQTVEVEVDTRIANARGSLRDREIDDIAPNGVISQ